MSRSYDSSTLTYSYQSILFAPIKKTDPIAPTWVLGDFRLPSGQMGSDSITYCPHCEEVCIPPWVSSVLMVEAGGFAPPSCLVFSLDYQTIFLFIPSLFSTNTFYFVLWNNLVCTFVISDCHSIVF